MKKILLILLVIVFALAANIYLDQQKVLAQGKRDFVENEVLVKFKEGTGVDETNDVHTKLGNKVKEVIPGINVQVVETKKSIGETISAYAKENKVEFVEPNFIASALEVNDEYYGYQWTLNNTGAAVCSPLSGTCTTTGTANVDINAPEAWVETTGSSAVKIAILDTGIDYTHPDLDGKIVLEKDFTGGNDPKDYYGHGTHVAGIAGGETNNSQGVAGVGYDSSLMNGKVLNNDGAGAYSWIANGMMWAADNGAKVINLSLGASQKSRTLENAVNYAWSRGVVIVAAAGNSNNPSATYPAKYNNVIAVAATNNRDQKASFSSYGDWVDIAAPGENVLSTFPTYTFKIAELYGRSQNYDFGSGTSMATPVVAGVAGLVWAQHPTAKNTDIRALIETTANPIAGTGTYWQNGRVDAYAAVMAPIPTGGGDDGGSTGGGKKCDSPPCAKSTNR